MKNGRRRKTSRTDSVGKSVVTKRLRQLLVTKSSRASGVENEWLCCRGRRLTEDCDADLDALLVVRADELRAPANAVDEPPLGHSCCSSSDEPLFLA